MDSLESLKLIELQALCKQRGIKGYSGKKKAEVIVLLQSSLPAPSLPAPSLPAPSLPAPSLPAPPPKKEVKEVKEVKVPKPKTKPLLPKPQLLPAPVSLLPARGFDSSEAEEKSSSELIKLKTLFPDKAPLLPGVFGFETQTEELFLWLKKPPSLGILYGASGIGKTHFLTEFAKAVGWILLEIESLDDPLLFTPPIKKNQIAILDTLEKLTKVKEKAGKSKNTWEVHCLVVSQDKPTNLPETPSLALQARRQPAGRLTKWLATQFPAIPLEHLATLCELNGGDLRHVLLTLRSGFSKASEKDDLVDTDARGAASALYNLNLSFDKRVDNALLDLDIVFCYTQEGLVKNGMSFEKMVDSLDAASFTDCITHQEGRASGVVAVGEKGARGGGRVPFVPFPSWYGKYSRTEKHKKWLSVWKSKGFATLEEVFAFRLGLFEKGNALAEEGLGVKGIAGKIFEELEKREMTVQEVFEDLDEFLFEGAEVDSFDDTLMRELKKL